MMKTPMIALVERAFAALEAGAAQHHGGDGREFVELARGRLTGLQPGGKHHPGNAAERPAPHIGRRNDRG